MTLLEISKTNRNKIIKILRERFQANIPNLNPIYIFTKRNKDKMSC